jgi:hypothetical protein
LPGKKERKKASERAKAAICVERRGGGKTPGATHIHTHTTTAPKQADAPLERSGRRRRKVDGETGKKQASKASEPAGVSPLSTARQQTPRRRRERERVGALAL